MNKNLCFSLLGCVFVQVLSGCGTNHKVKLPSPEECRISATSPEKCTASAVEHTREEVMRQLGVKTWAEALKKAPEVEQLAFHQYFSLDAETLSPFKNLKRLDASHGMLNSFSFVGSLSKLEELDLNLPDSPEERKGFSLPLSVTKLTVRNASQAELEILTRQTDLKFLRLVSSVKINDWSGLNGLTKIESLSIQLACRNLAV